FEACRIVKRMPGGERRSAGRVIGQAVQFLAVWKPPVVASEVFAGVQAGHVVKRLLPGQEQAGIGTGVRTGGQGCGRPDEAGQLVNGKGPGGIQIKAWSRPVGAGQFFAVLAGTSAGTRLSDLVKAEGLSGPPDLGRSGCFAAYRPDRSRQKLQ